MEEPKHIDLHLPRGWNDCTTEELEMIATAMLVCQARTDRYHPFDTAQVKVMAVMMINGLTVVDSQEDDGQEGKYLLSAPHLNDGEPFGIEGGQIVALTEMLDWIYDDQATQPLFVFPYPEMRLEVRGKRFLDKSGGKAEREVSGPPPLLDGYTWREYRLLQDWMSLYMRQQNNLIKVATLRRHDKEAMRRYQESMEQAQREFLAVLFKPVADNLDGKTAEHTVSSDLFADFSPVRWQVILFWWSGLMQQLAKKFPRVFKSQPVGKRRQQKHTPWDFYNQVTASVQKYVGGLSAQEVDNQPYGVTLQQLEMMARESEEMEKISKRK